MSKAKVIMAAFAAVLALSALASASASAATVGWMVNGQLLTGSKALATTAAVDETATLSGGGFSLKCNGAILKGTTPEITSPSMGSAGSLLFTECISTTTNCILSSGDKEIGTVPILSESTLEGASGVRSTFMPKTGSIFATIKFEGENCSGSGVKAVTGSAVTSSPTGQTESILQLLSVNTVASEGTLKFASGAAKLTGSALLKLASGEPWSYL